MRVVVSLTTIPGRERLVEKTIESLLRQTWHPDAIYLWLPRERFDDNVDNLRFPGVDVRIGADQGPAMKLLPTLSTETDPDTAIITVDDDVEYPPRLVDKLVRASDLLPAYAIGFTGWSVVGGTSASAVLAHMNEGVPISAFFQPVQVLEGTRGVLYRRRFFSDDISEHLNALEAFRYHDDILFSGYLASRGVTRAVRWFNPCPADDTNPWTIHCQDSGLHTTANWFERGWDCWDYWSTEQSRGIAPELGTLASADRLQLGSETCMRDGFTHHRLDLGVTERETTHSLEKMPWPWPDNHFQELLAIDVFARPSLKLEDCLAESVRILRPGGVLMFRVPITPALCRLTERAGGLAVNARSFCRVLEGSIGDSGHQGKRRQQALENLTVSIERDGDTLSGILVVPG